jgi:hypothetical protein
MDVESLFWVFPGELWFWRGPAPYHFIQVPEDVSADLHALSAVVSYGWGVIPVKVRIGESDWPTSLFPKDGGYLVPIKNAIRDTERIALGDSVLVEMSIRS